MALSSSRKCNAYPRSPLSLGPIIAFKIKRLVYKQISPGYTRFEFKMHFSINLDHFTIPSTLSNLIQSLTFQTLHTYQSTSTLTVSVSL